MYNIHIIQFKQFKQTAYLYVNRARYVQCQNSQSKILNKIRLKRETKHIT